MLTKRESEALRRIASLGRMRSNLYIQLVTAIDEMTEKSDVMFIKMNMNHTTAEPIASVDDVAYAAAADSPHEMNLGIYRAMARELIQRRK